MGTEGYVAPELPTGSAFTASADMYSLGVTALELLTGDKSIGGLRLSPYPDEVKDLVRNLLATNPAVRPTSFVVAQRMLALSGKNTWTLQAPSQPETDWGAVLVLGVAAVGIAALLKSK
jgi:serine/threonine protein kinase